MKHYLRKVAGAPFAILGLTLLALSVIVWSPFPGGLWHDDGVYLLVGKSLADGNGLSYGGVPGQPPAAKFPPVYSAVLALLWLVFGTIERVVAAAQILNLSLAVTAGVLFARFLHRQIGLDRWHAVGVTALGWLSVELWQFSMIPLSEPLFLVILTLFLALSTEAEDGIEGRRLVALGALTGILVLTRSIGLAVALAGFVALLTVRRFRAAGAVGIGLGALAPWMVWSRGATESIPVPLRDILGSYSTWWFDRATSDLSAFLAGIPGSVVGNAERVLRMTFPGVAVEVRWALGLLVFPIMIWGTALLLRRSRSAGLGLLFYLAVLALWPFQDRRLLVPVIPLLVTVLLLRIPLRPSAEGRFAKSRPAEASGEGSVGLALWWQRALFGLGAVWVAFYGGTSLYRVTQGYPQAGHEIRRDALAAATQAVERTGANNEVVGAPELWAALHLYTGRPVAPSAPFRPGSVGRISGTPQEQWAVWSAGGVEHLLAEHGGLVHAQALDSLEARCPAVMQIMATLPGAILLDIGRQDPCVRAELERAVGN